MHELYQKVVITPDLLAIFPDKETQIRKLIGDAVENSIVDILPPVVDRSVTIALITTRELVIKDFACDGDPDKVLRASAHIVQNLAGSLALVTCREPLKISLQGKLKNDITNQINLCVLPTVTDEKISEFSQYASKENLELGCKIIKQAVIERALNKVKEDSKINEAVEMRQKSKAQGNTVFKD